MKLAYPIAFMLLALTAAVASTRPNIIIILTDDSGYTDLGSYGGEIDTPNIDLLAKYGARLSNFYTNGRCSPTRASLLSGLDCAKMGFGGGTLGNWQREMPFPAHRGRLPYEQPILPELLKASGYHTMMAGKWHLGGSLMKYSKSAQKQWKVQHQGWELTGEELEADFNSLPMQRGFDEYFGIFGAQHHFFILPGQNHPYMEGNQPAGLWFNRAYDLHCYSQEPGKGDGRDHGVSGKAFYDTDGVTDRAIQMIQRASGEDKPPFFMYVAYRAPHKPLQAPEELVQKYLLRYKDLPAIENSRVDQLREEGLFPREAGFRPKYIPASKEDDFRRQAAIHAAMMEKVDENVGRLMQTLAKSGELENTLVLYLSDNGCASHINGFMNAPYHGSKALLWEGGTKSHCIAVWPDNIQPGSIIDAQIWVGDLVPAILEAAGSGLPDRFRGQQPLPLDGRNILPILKGGHLPPAEALFFNDKGQQSVIYQERWKLLIEPGWYLQVSAEPGITVELYDLHADPAESVNLADQYPDLVKMLTGLCDQWKAECGIVDYAQLIKLRPKDPF